MPPTKTPQLISVLEKSDKNVESLLTEILALNKYKKLVLSFCNSCGLDFEQILLSLKKLSSGEKEFSQIVEGSFDSAADLGHGFVDVEHVFNELFNSSPTIRKWAESVNFPADDVLEAIQPWLTLKGSDEETEEENDKRFPALENLCSNLSKEVFEGDCFCFGREKEISQILDILCRQKKSNIILVGDPGVGRKTIVHGVIEKILSGESSEILKDKEFFLVNPTRMIAGTAMVGSMEARFTTLIKEAETHGSCVLVINGMSQIFGGKKEYSGSSDTSSMFLPIFENSKISVIGIATPEELRKVEKDSSIMSRFEKIEVCEPTKDQTRQIIESSISELESYHNVDIPTETVSAVIDLCERFLPYRKFPEKAFDVLDHLGAQAKNKHTIKPDSLMMLERKLAETFDPTAEEGTPLYKKMAGLIEKYGKSMNKWIGKIEKTRPLISEKDAILAFAEKYKIKENQLKQMSGNTIDDIRQRIKENVFGQDNAVDKIMDVLLCSKVGLRDKNKPMAKFLFVGKTGVGKTQVCKELALNFFGDEKNMLKLDMSEFQNRGSLSSLIGTSAGWVGYGDGGRLTEYVKNNPSCVVLFDEIEKCDRDILNILLQIMDEGYLTDGQGQRIDFTNTIVCMTSNLGSETATQSMGFVNTKANGERFLDAVKKGFPPEWIARLDEIVAFNDMSEKMLSQIIEKSLKSVKDKLFPNIAVTIHENVQNELLKKLKNQDNDARNVQATVRREIEIPLAKFIVDKGQKTIIIKVENNKIEIQ